MLLARIASEPGPSDNKKTARSRQRKTAQRALEDSDLREQRLGIQLMWEDGYSMAEIAETMEINPTSLGNEMTRMRKQGWNLPYRRRKATA